MAPKLPDHLGRMPDHPRYGNPSDPAEEAERIAGAAKNLDDWRDKYGGEFSGGVRMSYGGQAFDVQVGDKEIAQKITSRALPTTRTSVQVFPEPAESAPEPPPITVQLPPQFWLWRLINRIMGALR